MFSSFVWCFLILQILIIYLNSEQARLNVKAGFIASINFVGSSQPLTAKQSLFLSENTFR